VNSAFFLFLFRTLEFPFYFYIKQNYEIPFPSEALQHEASANIKIINVPNNFITSGTLNSNTVWKGCVRIVGNITVPTGITLTINPNSTITFMNNSSLIINGTLNATNCQFGGDIGTWGSITFDGSGASNSMLNFATVKNGVGIRCLNGANVTVTNSTIDHCTEGVYIYNSQPNISGNQIIEPVQNGINVNASGLSPLIQSNSISKTSSNPQYRQYQGIYLSNNSNGYIAKNDISGFYWGMYIGGGSDAYFTNYSNQAFSQNNRVMNSRIGIGAGWGAYIFAGMWKSYGRNNNISNNINYDAYSYQSSNIVAQCNWWGNDGAQTFHDGSSSLDADLPLTYDPWIPQDNTIIEENELIGDGNINKIIIPDSCIIQGILLEFRGRSNEAIFHYKNMIKNNRNADFAIGRLVAIMNRYNVSGIREFIESLLLGNNTYKPIVLTVLAGKLLEENKYEESKILFNRIINDYPDSYFAVNARFEKFFAALSLENNLNDASELLVELRALSLNDIDYLIRLQDAENQFALLGTQLIEKPLTKQQIITELGKPDSYALNANYPNPFNPSTIIQFSIPEKSFVELKVFDILGNEVDNLVKQDMEPGNYSVIFNGSNLASGIYLYRLISGNFVDTRKMMLIK